MQQLLNFFFKNRTTVLFLILFLVAFTITTQSHDYHKSKFLNSSNQISGSIHGVFSSVGNYFNLKKENTILLEENNRLKAFVFNSKTGPLDTANFENKFKLTPAIVHKNSYRNLENYITLNIGENEGIKEDFGVITSKGIIGIIDQTSSNYSRVLSILNAVCASIAVTDSTVSTLADSALHSALQTNEDVFGRYFHLSQTAGDVAIHHGRTTDCKASLLMVQG